MDWTFLWGKQTNLQTQRKRRHCHFENLWKTKSGYCGRSFAIRLSLIKSYNAAIQSSIRQRTSSNASYQDKGPLFSLLTRANTPHERSAQLPLFIAFLSAAFIAHIGVPKTKPKVSNFSWDEPNPNWVNVIKLRSSVGSDVELTGRVEPINRIRPKSSYNFTSDLVHVSRGQTGCHL